MKNRKLFSILFTFVTILGSQMLHARYSEDKTYYDIVRVLTSLQTQFPDHAELINLGLSDSGADIIGIKIGNGELENLVVATHHGNEYGSTEVAEALAISLANNPIAGQTIYVIPVLNISGYNSRRRREMTPGGSLDPNRDYPGPCGTSGPFQLKSTKALDEFIKKTAIISSITIHTSWPAVLYPWGISTNDLETGYTDLFIEMGELATYYSGYTVANSTEELYAADGTFEDFAFWRHGIWSLLFEIGHTHSPNQDQIEELIRTNVPGIRKMFEASQMVRAENHGFTGTCNGSAAWLDRHDE